MILVLVVGGGVGWLGHRVRVRREAVAAITKAGGNLYYDYQMHGRSPIPGRQPPVPAWLTRSLGVDAFADVVSVGVNEPYCTDELMAQIGRLPRVRYLSLRGGSLTDLGASSLRGLTEVEDLELKSCRITGATLRNLTGMRRLSRLQFGSLSTIEEDLAPLAQLPTLTWLHVTDPLIDDELAYLAGLKSLRILNLTGEYITAAGIGHLSGLTNLTTVYLNRTRVASLEPLRACTAIDSLGLAGTEIDDRGLATVAGFRKLKRLGLVDTRVTDLGLRHLTGLNMLIELDLEGCRISDEGLKSLSAMTRMSTLGLGRTGIGDAGLDRIKHMKQITFLFLNDTKVSDAGLAKLTNLASCRQIGLRGTTVTDAGVAALKARYPTMGVVR